MIDERSDHVASLVDRTRRTLGHLLDRADSELTHTHARVVALSPAATLKRGYAVLQRADGHVVRGPDEVTALDVLRARVAEGEFTVRVDASDGAAPTDEAHSPGTETGSGADTASGAGRVDEQAATGKGMGA